MTFNDNASLDTGSVSSGGSGGGGGFGGGGGMAPGGIAVGGIGGVILMILMVLFGGGLTGGQPGGGVAQPEQVGAAGTGGDDIQAKLDACKTGADANRDDTCRIKGAVGSIENFWAGYLPKYGKEYTPAMTKVYSGTTQTQCGTGSAAMGPFYCPLDQQVYIDASFFQELSSKYGADGGPLAQMYVVAHEYGHHIQNELGVLDRAQQDPQGAESGAVRTELQADCFAGLWAHDAANTKDKNGVTLIKPLTDADVQSALSAASAVGDDRIQEKSQGRVTPESWTHGSSEQRQKWFMQGYTTGDLNKCDTFNAQNLG